jgi:carboxyl-terminal processing protease
VRVTQFQEHTGELLAEALTKLYKDNKEPLKGLILDLRNDPGGLLNGAVAVTAAFVKPDSLVVYTEGRTEDAKMRLTASRENYLRPMQLDYMKNLPEGVKQVPMVVLVNSGSASASEIVAGALQDHKRAVVMGTRTFGKGSVQTILPIGNGTAIKLTTARYFTPNGRSIQAKGIEPDIVVEDPSMPSESEGLGIREADLDKHLSNPNGEEELPASKPGTSIKAPADKSGADGKDKKPPTLEPGEVVSKNDFQMNQALNLLKGLQILQGR